MSDWTHIKFLESAENLKYRLKVISGRTPSTSIAREVGVCLQQGRLFFQSAEQSALEIRPLLLFYGTLAFAKALAVGRNQQSLSTLPPSHGISDISTPNARLADLRVHIGSSGTFQRFNDVASQLNYFEYYHQSMPQRFGLPTASSPELERSKYSLQDILSRIPGLEKLYKETFREPPNSGRVSSFGPEPFDATLWQLRIDDSELFSDRTGLQRLIKKWRDRFPILKRMRVVEASHAWNNSIILFGNVEVPPAELDEESLPYTGTAFVADYNPAHRRTSTRIPIETIIVPDGGSLAGSQALIAPHQGCYASHHSLHYLGMFLLSSLVRYRPQIWVHAINRSVMGERSADDQTLALIEAFMNLHSNVIPDLTLKALSG